MSDSASLDEAGLHGSVEQHNQAEAPSLLKLDPGVGIWAIVVFVILLLLLKKFAWGPIITSIDERDKSIRDSLEKAKQTHHESKKIAAEQGLILAEAKSESAKFVQQAKEMAESISSEIRAEAKKEKQRIIDSGIKEIEAAKIAAVNSIKMEMADMAISIAEKLLQESLDTEKNRMYVNKLINEYQG